MSFLLKKFSDFLGISDPEYIRAPPLDGEIIYCKNNVCVHPPSSLAKTAEHYPGYLTLRSQGNGRVASSLILTWIPNSSLEKHQRMSPRTSPKQSPVKNEEEEENLKPHAAPTDAAAKGDAEASVSSEDDAPEAAHDGGGDAGRQNPVAISESCQDSEAEGDGSVELESGPAEQNRSVSVEMEDKKNKEDADELNSNPESPVSPQRRDVFERPCDTSPSSESDSFSTDARLAHLLGNKNPCPEKSSTSTELERPKDLNVGPADTMANISNSKVKDESLSSASSNPSSLPSPLRSLMRDQMLRDLQDSSDMDSEDRGASVSSSTTPTTSNPDPGSLPSSPGNEPFDPFIPLYNQNTPPSHMSPASPIVSHNLTFPENSIEYTSAGSKSASKTPKEQLCGVFSVDLSHMRSLRVFFSGENSNSGQLVIASQESQYKILHFHHGGLERLTKVFDHWQCCVKQKTKSKLLDKDSDNLYHKFTILQSRMKPADYHPEEGVYDEVNEEMWWSYLNERGQVEDDYELRKAIFFGGIDEYLRREIWPFLLHYFAFDSTLEERNALRGQKREEYEAIKEKRLAMSVEEQEVFFRNVKCTVDKDVVRTDRSHPYFKGENNPNIDIMRNILLSFAVYKPTLGYTQGMSDLLAPVLAELQDEADAFWCLVGLMDDVIFVSSPKDEDMEKQLGYLRALIKLMLPDFWNHLLFLNDAMDLLFCHRWILLCFKREFNEPEALKMWEACWAHYQTDYFHLFICLAIIAVYGEDVVHQKLPSDDMLLHFSNLAMQMNGDLVLKKARGLLHQFRLLPRIPCTLDGLCETCTPGMWDSGHTPEVECVGLGVHGKDYICPHISSDGVLQCVGISLRK
ncbi:TBC1 domain family member 16-like [Acanthaster planci]|uniref:TBC1 domain family member 16-like n=1 Tax=Acanthaster planci TaxID=133434 RepID=A0A8B7YM79_ACAPL|nr:TBC1 domain family member 16-like [Acanthaster planci]XP_022093551.1 TBC1 domain family member 16-like [Acanthaster planci]XP_022093552.1 TBC1 domain family member 16-like [Acanthaster planci]XP_022093553.1 TBC1 domain family member 16-like [Acanthaster planci]